MTAWLDMERFPADDPDGVLGADDAALVRDLLTRPVPDVPDEVWRRMLDVTWSTIAEDEGDDPPCMDPPEHPDDGDGPGFFPVVVDGDGPHTTTAFHDDLPDGDDTDDFGDDAC